jgi:hypothetical protein
VRPADIREVIATDRKAGMATPIVALADLVIEYMAADLAHEADEDHEGKFERLVRATVSLLRAVGDHIDYEATVMRAHADLVRRIAELPTKAVSDPGWQQRVLDRIDQIQSQKPSWWRRMWRAVRRRGR